MVGVLPQHRVGALPQTTDVSISCNNNGYHYNYPVQIILFQRSYVALSEYKWLTRKMLKNGLVLCLNARCIYYQILPKSENVKKKFTSRQEKSKPITYKATARCHESNLSNFIALNFRVRLLTGIGVLPHLGVLPHPTLLVGYTTPNTP